MLNTNALPLKICGGAEGTKRHKSYAPMLTMRASLEGACAGIIGLVSQENMSSSRMIILLTLAMQMPDFFRAPFTVREGRCHGAREKKTRAGFYPPSAAMGASCLCTEFFKEFFGALAVKRDAKQKKYIINRACTETCANARNCKTFRTCSKNSPARVSLSTLLVAA